MHPQTILAYGMNGSDLPIGHGAPLHLRVERRLGYEQAKFVMRVEAVASLDGIGGGLGGYREDVAGYEWYAERPTSRPDAAHGSVARPRTAAR